jgi:hypothetical protein
LAKLSEWCSTTDSKINSHLLEYFEADTSKLAKGIVNLATILPHHYVTPERLAGILSKLGKKEVARYVEMKLPTGPRGRSGDIGEILAASWVKEFTNYGLMLNKLRWKDHREMAMRGDDILAFELDPTLEIRFLKGEVKSRASLNKETIESARDALLSNGGRPTPHALAFVSDRLVEVGEYDQADLIDKYSLKLRLKVRQMAHLMFVFSGNNPRNLLSADLRAYRGRIEQRSVGIRVSGHQAFIKAVFDKVVANATRP